MGRALAAGTANRFQTFHANPCRDDRMASAAQSGLRSALLVLRIIPIPFIIDAQTREQRSLIQCQPALTTPRSSTPHPLTPRLPPRTHAGQPPPRRHRNHDRPACRLVPGPARRLGDRRSADRRKDDDRPVAAGENDRANPDGRAASPAIGRHRTAKVAVYAASYAAVYAASYAAVYIAACAAVFPAAAPSGARTRRGVSRARRHPLAGRTAAPR